MRASMARTFPCRNQAPHATIVLQGGPVRGRRDTCLKTTSSENIPHTTLVDASAGLYDHTMQELLHKLPELVATHAFPLAQRLIGALIVWFVGRWAIDLVRAAVDKRMSQRNVDKTIARYTQSIVGSSLNLFLGFSVLGILGVETTTFAALLAAAGLAIGTAWAGLLANFAAGIFLILLKPYKVGDMISAGGVTGDVVELGLFATTVHTVDNVRVVVGNNKIFGDNIQNFTHNPYRRVDLKAQLPHGVDPRDAIAKLRARLSQIPNVMTDPAPSVEILEFNLAGPVLCARPFCANQYYWDVYFATNAAIVAVFTEADYPVPETHHLVKRVA
jgi:small conductance mechanosensitive channel